MYSYSACLSSVDMLTATLFVTVNNSAAKGKRRKGDGDQHHNSKERKRRKKIRGNTVIGFSL